MCFSFISGEFNGLHVDFALTSRRIYNEMSERGELPAAAVLRHQSSLQPPLPSGDLSGSIPPFPVIDLSSEKPSGAAAAGRAPAPGSASPKPAAPVGGTGTAHRPKRGTTAAAKRSPKKPKPVN